MYSCGGVKVFISCLLVFYYCGVSVSCDSYIGCFKEHSEEEQELFGRYFPDFRQDLDRLTPDLCRGLCFRKGFKLAGVQFGKECHCTNREISKSRKTDDGECQMPCQGDAMKKCGGSLRLGVYAANITNTPSTSEKAAPGYVGCFKENSEEEQETFGRYFPDLHLDINRLTPEKCKMLCSRSRFKYAGVEAGKECYCTNKELNMKRKTGDGDCQTPCQGDATKKCGGTLRLGVYAANSTDSPSASGNSDSGTSGQNSKSQSPQVGTTPPPYCAFSQTIANGERVCKKSVILLDDFQKLDLSRWRYEIKIASDPDFDFTVYDSSPENIFVKDGSLFIQPTVYNESFVESGEINLERCTGDSYRGECSMKTDVFILPPVQSARIVSTKKFKYGVIEIEAKFPLGDWITADIRLEPAEYSYGSYYKSGRIRILSRGNLNLKDKDGREIGSQTVEGIVMIGDDTDVKTKSIYFTETSGWQNAFHNFTIIWTPDDISFMIDGGRKNDIMEDAYGSKLSDFVGFQSSKIQPWSTGTPLAPFDQAFFVSLGVSVGGIRDFHTDTKDSAKPWSDSTPWPRTSLTFWNKRNEWRRTWQTGSSAFIIKSIKVTAV